MFGIFCKGPLLLTNDIFGSEIVIDKYAQFDFNV